MSITDNESTSIEEDLSGLDSEKSFLSLTKFPLKESSVTPLSSGPSSIELRFDDLKPPITPDIILQKVSGVQVEKQGIGSLSVKVSLVKRVAKLQEESANFMMNRPNSVPRQKFKVSK